MAKCALGPRKLRKIERLTGRPVRQAFVRGGWEHGWALVFFVDTPDTAGEMVNYHTGAYAPRPSASVLRRLPALREAGWLGGA